MKDYEKIRKYKQYLNTIDGILSRYFKEQEEYICCKNGCAYCCQSGVYPYSELEFIYLSLGLFSLDTKTQQGVMERIKVLKEECRDVENIREHMYRCPFLDEKNSCTVYDFRGLICRTFGLPTITPKGKLCLPFCHTLGLNYSTVYDNNNKALDYKKVKELGYKNMPNAYKIHPLTLMDKDMFVDEAIDFGEMKALIEWL